MTVCVLVDLEDMCRLLHDEYEQAAAEEGWVTHPDLRGGFDDCPDANKKTMRRALRAVLMEVGARFTTEET